MVLLVLAFEGHWAGPQAQANADALERLAAAEEEAGRTSEAFELYVRAFRALSPVPPLETDVRIRERILALAPRLQTPPPVPEDAERSLIRGQMLLQDAKNEADLEKAIAELRNAVRAAPWLPELAFNLALVQEQAAFYRSAAANLKLYLRTNPSDAQEIRRKTYELELRRETDKAAGLKEDCALGDASACAALASAEQQERMAAEAAERERARKEQEQTSVLFTVTCKSKDLRLHFFRAVDGKITGKYQSVQLTRGTSPVSIWAKCESGTSVCYGANWSWLAGHIGVGENGDKSCSDCCRLCGGSMTLTCQ